MSGNQWYTGHDDTFAYPEGEMGGTTTLAAPFLGGSENRTKYTYDGIARLATYESVSYGYDDANNRTSRGTKSYGYNASNEISSGTGFQAFGHDSRGNLTTKNRSGSGDQNFDYDWFNRLVSYTPGGSGATWRYYYDALGRRVKKTNGTETRYYFHDGWRVVVELIEISGQTTQVREYIHGNGIDEVLLEYLPDDGQKWFWPLIDSLGTVRDLADQNGSAQRVRMSYDYTPEGTLTSETNSGGAVTQDVLFQGRTLERETVTTSPGTGGVYYFRARHYDPELQRFLQRDPIGVWGDETNLGNGYAVIANNPANNLDPTGLTIVIGGRSDNMDFASNILTALRSLCPCYSYWIVPNTVSVSVGGKSSQITRPGGRVLLGERAWSSKEEKCKCFREHMYGCCLIKGLVDSATQVTIRGWKEKAGKYEPTVDEIIWNPEWKGQGNESSTAFIVLGHELIHGYRDQSKAMKKNKKREENETVRGENRLREEARKAGSDAPVRESYGGRLVPEPTGEVTEGTFPPPPDQW